MNNDPRYYVSRQAYYYSGENVVEIAIGGTDYSGPDMLVEQFRNQGEGVGYIDPREAAQAAQRVAIAWALTSDDEPKITVVNTCGMSMEGEPMLWSEVQKWAEETYEGLPKCERCGTIIPGTPIHAVVLQEIQDEEYCSERCADEASDEETQDHYYVWLEDTYEDYLDLTFEHGSLQEVWIALFDEGTGATWLPGTAREEILQWFDTEYPGGLEALQKQSQEMKGSV